MTWTIALCMWMILGALFVAVKSYDDLQNLRKCRHTHGCWRGGRCSQRWHYRAGVAKQSIWIFLSAMVMFLGVVLVIVMFRGVPLH